jgi:HEAT repeat protein
MLPSARGDLSAAIVLAIARIGSVDDRALLRARLADRSAPIRRAAVEGLGRIGDRESRQSIAGFFAADPDAHVRLAAAFALEKFGENQAHVIAARVSRDTVVEGRDYLLELGGQALPGLLAVLKESRDARHRADLLHLVGWTGSTTDVESLTPFRTDRDERVSRAAANAVARIQREVRSTK